jgi:hypothetical protein
MLNIKVHAPIALNLANVAYKHYTLMLQNNVQCSSLSIHQRKKCHLEINHSQPCCDNTQQANPVFLFS